MIAALLLAALIGPTVPGTPHPSEARKAIRMDAALLTLGAAVDLGATEYTLRTCLSCREGNPMGPRMASRIALRAAGVALGATICQRLRRDGHPRAARVLGLLGLSGGVVAGAVNLGKAK